MACPENTVNMTECLLRAILDAQSGFNWDPLNFACTAAIGVLALIVAAVTVFQGLLSAGPGRIKASEEAIGHWAKYTKIRFSWTEMRLRTSTKTPFIKSVWDLKEEGDNDKELQDDFGSNGVRAYPARWRSLIESAGATLNLEKTSQTTEQLGSQVLVDIDTDYLPSDIQAAPAWATVKTVLQIAGLAGCNKFTMTPGSLYPEARGPHSQLRFREHPDLGGIATFDQFIRERLYSKGRGRQERYWADVLTENTVGVHVYKNHWMNYTFAPGQYGILSRTEGAYAHHGMHARSERCSHHQCLAYDQGLFSDACTRRILVPLIAPSPLSPRVLRLSSGQYLDTLKYIGLQYESPGISIRFSDIAQRIKGLAKIVLPDNIEDNDLIYFQGDESYRFCLSASVKGYKMGGASSSSRGSARKLQMGWSWLLPELGFWFSRYPDEDMSPFAGYIEKDSSQVHVERLVLLPDLDLILRNVMDGKLQSFEPLTRPEDMRVKLQLQLQEIDAWLHRFGGALSACQLRILVMDAVFQMKRDQSSTDSPQNPANQVPPETSVSTLEATPPHDTNAAAPCSSHTPQPPFNGSSPGQEEARNKERRSLEAKEKGMRALLILRAAIWTAYIHTAGDISFLYDGANGDIRNRVVQVI